MRAYGPHRMCNISEYIYEISGVKLIAGFPSATVAILAAFFTRFRCTLWVVFKVPTAMLAAFTTCF
ncbi:hypothetical protein SCA50_1636 [Salmonella enterica subsp. enterica serovar Choleraesuis str. SCSA50]|uniref:YciF n=3 Tax=Salmonella enterica I TaxID=59201 RepID=C0Q4V4_SALPC|nr:hypothetical protein SCH_1531 [Salmonella enterica subsp. enterica serovar Choleraesuis str. SC-B67]ACN46337.1 yciF [Salmonella enterica subsp. enterica serovar Paratyphi C str. RKS4594]EFZ06143.1 hypothetical protein SCA50_1636 [Salmonella enterica subsp. enterica serovar Choleraesuis str. SCSA50]